MRKHCLTCRGTEYLIFSMSPEIHIRCPECGPPPAPEPDWSTFPDADPDRTKDGTPKAVSRIPDWRMAQIFKKLNKRLQDDK